MNRRSKSLGKEVSRGLEDEVKDYAFQPLKSLNLFDELRKKLAKRNNAVPVSDDIKNNPKKPNKYAWRQYLSAEQVSLARYFLERPSNHPFFNSNMIKGFAEGLRGDGLECYEHMYDVRYLCNKQVLSSYGEIYNQLKTIPIVFLSVVKTGKKEISTIYVWQFNEFCPVEVNPTKIAVDCTFKSQRVFVPHHSILLLAKFETTDQEELLDGQFLSDSRIVIKSRISASHIRFKEYDMMDLINLVTINPYNAKSDNNRFYCASKLDISFDEMDRMLNYDLSRIRRLKEIELLEYAGVDAVSMFIKTDSYKYVANCNVLFDDLFTEVYSDGESSYIVTVDRSLLKAIMFKKDSLKVIDLSNFGGIHSIFQDTNMLYFLNQEGRVFKITPSLCTSEKPYQDLDVKIPVNEAEKIKFCKDEDAQYLVYLIGSKFYATLLEVKGTSEYLFDVEELGKEEQRGDKFEWEVVEDKLVVIRGIYIYVYDLTDQKFTKGELRSTEFLENEWKLLAEKDRLFALSKSKYEESWRIFRIALKENDVEDFSDDLTAAYLKKSEESIYMKLTGPGNNIVFLRLKDPYLLDTVNQVTGMPNYLCSNYVPGARRVVPILDSYWERQQEEKEQKRKEEFQKKVEREKDELVEYTEIKAKMERFIKDSSKKKATEKPDEERKGKMKELRKAIVNAGKEEGADKNDKRLKDVKEEYMTMYQDLKKEKKKQNREKEKNKLKDRKNARNNKCDY